MKDKKYTYFFKDNKKENESMLKRMIIGSTDLSEAYNKILIYTNKDTKKQIIIYSLGLNVMTLVCTFLLKEIIGIRTESAILAIIFSLIYGITLRNNVGIKIPKQQTQESIENVAEIAEIETMEENHPAQVIMEQKEFSKEEKINNQLLFTDALDIFLKTPKELAENGVTVADYHKRTTEREVRRIKERMK